MKQLFYSLLHNLLSIINYEFSYFNFAMFSYFALRIEIWIYAFFEGYIYVNNKKYIWYPFKHPKMELFTKIVIAVNFL